MSLRLFTPSQTDLSAIVIVHKPQIPLSLTTQLGEEIAQTWEEQITSPSGESTEARFMTVIFKPADGFYRLELSGIGDGADAQVFVYDERANLTLLPLPEGFSAGTLFIDFAKAGETVWVNEPPAAFSWAAFISELDQLRTKNDLSPIVFTRLKAIAHFAQGAPSATWPRYKQFARTAVEFYNLEIDGEIKEYLLSLLD